MPYWQIVTRSFRIAWDHKYLWLIALFSGEAGSTSFNYSQRTTQSTNRPPDIAAIQAQVTTWVSNHIGLLIALGVVWLILAIAFFILAAVCEGATIRASAEHDAERPFGLGLAWRTGVHLMWAMVRFRLLILALNLPLFLLVAGWFVGVFVAIVNHNRGAVLPLVLTGLLLLVVWFVYGTYLFLLDRIGTRALVLEELIAIPALARANHLVLKRLGRTVLVWLVAIGVSLVVVLALVCVVGLAVAPFVGFASLASSGSSAATIIVGVVLAIIFIPIVVVVSAFFAAQSSTYWTLAFRRLDLDYAPAYAYPVVPQAPPSPQA
jgi:hypothetical protein